MITPNAIAARNTRNSGSVSSVSNPLVSARKGQRCLIAVALLLIVSMLPGPALGQNLQWAKRAGGTAFDTGYGIAVDSSGNVYVTGYFNGTATFGPAEPNQTILTAAGLSDIYVAK